MTSDRGGAGEGVGRQVRAVLFKTTRRIGESARWHVTGALGKRPEREHFLRHLRTGTVGAEIGVFRGEFSASILQVVRPRELHLIDGWWELYGDTYPDWGAYTDFGRLATRLAYSDTESQVAAHQRDAKVEIHVGDDCSILEQFDDGFFDWVYLDSSHQYDDTVRELEVLSRKVKEDGVIAGDDWKDDPEDPNHGASVAIKEFCATTRWRVAERDQFNQWLLRQER